MRFVHLTSPGRLEFNWLWAPTWVGMNNQLKGQLERDLGEAVRVAGMPATEENLDQIHEVLLDLLVERYPEVPGLRDYLDGIKFVRP
jgi:hypothetical protein